eukprot:TRINITY_DN75666_c0_g1_i1.p1 TRINITY_DN75666_c0_g1~~TRINITY_DN75666_c0_g1_i1.p1  ORF type:complete len:370 (+),score=50.43 TRINITY_DN75666_c0_g1_i1:62-1171(+)
MASLMRIVLVFSGSLLVLAMNKVCNEMSDESCSAASPSASMIPKFQHWPETWKNMLKVDTAQRLDKDGLIYKVNRSSCEHEQACSVAVKEVAYEGYVTKDHFLHECAVMRALDSHRFIRLIECEALTQRGLMMMEVADESLLQLLIRTSESQDLQLPLARKFDIFRDMALALMDMHNANYVHRDVKPDNVFIVGDCRATCSVKLADFGFTCKTASSSRVERCSVRDSIGTWDYWAPEILKALATKKVVPYSFETDVWSLGLVFHEILASDYAQPAVCVMEADESFQTSEAHRVHPANWLSARAARASDALDSCDLSAMSGDARIPDLAKPLLLGMLERAPAKRWPMQRVLESVEVIRAALKAPDPSSMW